MTGSLVLQTGFNAHHFTRLLGGLKLLRNKGVVRGKPCSSDEATFCVQLDSEETCGSVRAPRQGSG